MEMHFVGPWANSIDTSGLRELVDRVIRGENQKVEAEIHARLNSGIQPEDLKIFYVGPMHEPVVLTRQEAIDNFTDGVDWGVLWPFPADNNPSLPPGTYQVTVDLAEVILSKMRTPYDDSATDSDRQHDIDLIAAAILAERQRCLDACTLSAREVELLYSAETARYIAGKISAGSHGAC